ncbi:hypothetical protein DOY81_000182 [Sarcophaga bullata]|nr:hypothetical protein DOY81_000182 [Sarcophaga bullata]
MGVCTEERPYEMHRDDAVEIHDETDAYEDDDDVEDDEKCIMYSILLHYTRREFSKLITKSQGCGACPTPPVAHQGSAHCGNAAGAGTGANSSSNHSSNHSQQFIFRSCSTCPDICEHSTKPFSAAAAAYSVAFRSYETAEQATFDESSIKYAINRNQTDCADGDNDETNSGISFKTEPYGPPSSPESATETKPNCSPPCAGCGRLIQDRFYLSAVDKRWHASCLQCYACRQPLDRESSCYSRDGNIYCKSDYYRLSSLTSSSSSSSSSSLLLLCSSS